MGAAKTGNTVLMPMLVRAFAAHLNVNSPVLAHIILIYSVGEGFKKHLFVGISFLLI